MRYVFLADRNLVKPQMAIESHAADDMDGEREPADDGTSALQPGGSGGL